MSWDNKPFKINDIHDFVPERLKPWLILSFVIIFQLSGGVYLASVSEMTGSLALKQEDVMMAGYASLVGLSLIFTIMFRLKFALSTKNSLLITASGLILCNIAVIHTHNLPVLIAICFISGLFRMWGTFAGNTIIQLWITPKREMAVWFVFIGSLVQIAIQVSGVFAMYVAFLSKWEYMHWFIVGLLLLVLILTLVLFKQFRFVVQLPLLGIDWTGMLLWASTLLSVIFFLNYGDHYDWFSSVYIRMALVIAIASLALNLWRASFIRHPFIELRAWKIKNVWLTCLLYIVIDILLSPSHLLEHIFTERILGYDSLHIAVLNWMLVAGVVLGAFISYQLFAVRKWAYKTMTAIGFCCITAYLICMYFLTDYNIPLEMLAIPLLLRGAGYVIIAITFLTALTGTDFKIFPQTLSIQAFVSACVGALLGSTILHQLFTIAATKNFMILSSNLDRIHYKLQHITQSELYKITQQQSVMVSIKELYGWLCIVSLLCLLLFFLKTSTLRPSTIHPKFKTIRRIIKHQLKIDYRARE